MLWHVGDAGSVAYLALGVCASCFAVGDTGVAVVVSASTLSLQQLLHCERRCVRTSRVLLRVCEATVFDLIYISITSFTQIYLPSDSPTHTLHQRR